MASMYIYALAAEQLQLKERGEIRVVIKATEVMVAKD
jgi:molybdopterin-binding protein